VSAIGVGGWHLSLKHVDEQLGLASFVRRRSGINFLDNSWDYNEVRVSGAWARQFATAIGTFVCDDQD